MSAERQFDTDQRSYYLNEINRAFPVSTRANDMSTIQTALGIVDPSMPAGTSDVTDSVRMLSDFGSSSDARSRDSACRGYSAPSTGMRDPAARTGCGWWYVPDPTLHSTGAYGSRRGPMDISLDKTMGTGQWIWDLTDANQLEGNKQASKLASCADLALNTYPNVGWCPSTNRGILTDGAGNPAYPQDPGGDCPGGGILMSAAQCPPPPPPSAGGPPAGAAGGGGITGLCNSSPLSPGCVQALVSQNSCSPNGLLSQSLSNGYPGQSSQFNAVYRFVQPSFQLSPAIMSGSGAPSDVTSATNAFRQFAQTATGRVGSAASNLCFGTPFDPCTLQDTDSGPYDPSCVVKEALRQGYSPNGGMVTGLNNNAPGSMDFWNSMPQWQNVRGDLAIIKQQADTAGNPKQQTNAIQTVYGVSVKYPKTGCNNYGIFMYRYFFPNWDKNYFPIQGPITHFLGRYIFKNGFPYKGSTYEDQTPAGGYLTEGQRYTTIFYPSQGGTYQFMLVSDDGLRMQINGQVVMDWHYCCGPPGYSTPINLIADQPYTIVIDFWNGGGPWAFQITASVNGGPFGDMPTDLKEFQLPVDRRLPMIEYVFNKMPSANYTTATRIDDTMNIFQNMFIDKASVGQLNGRQCMKINLDSQRVDPYGGHPSGLFNYLNTTQGVRLCSIKSFTMMLQINTINYTGTSPSIFSMFNLPESVTTGPPRGSWQPNYVQPYANRTHDFMITPNLSSGTIYPWGVGINPGQSVGITTFFNDNYLLGGGSFNYNQWFHFAFVWDDDFNGYTVYINGKQAIRAFVPAYDSQLIMEQIRIGCDNHPDGQWWSGGIAWFRAFDYRLSTDLITRDMNDDWSDLI